jgi:4-hydroxythreonine-4-phosphate dehydrogenase
MSALNAGLSLVGPKDILLTLPSSKDQFIYQNNNLAGHTEFFRNYFANPHISMLFVGEVFHLLLLTEHISISAVANFLEKDQFEMRIKLALANMPKVNKVILLGIDPHCGDKGAISHLDALWDRLSSTRWDPKVEFIGPVSADSLIQNSQLTKNALVVSAFHDQGLSLFKSLHGHMGINRTIGMPFMRLSPDHGTAFALYGKGSASIQGTLHTLLYALKNQD